MAAKNGTLFSSEKTRVLGKADLSRKGSVDEPIRELIEYINAQDCFYTTSSCSGRISIFSESVEHHKKNCKWLLVSHNKITLTQLVSSLRLTQPAAEGGDEGMWLAPPTLDKEDKEEVDRGEEDSVRSGGDVASEAKSYTFFKFEPFILHTMCRSLSDAQITLQVAVGSGFRNSGITFGKKGKIMLAVRSTHSLEVPVACDGELLVSEKYLECLVKLGNEKLVENQKRIAHFQSRLKQALLTAQEKEKETNHHQLQPRDQHWNQHQTPPTSHQAPPTSHPSHEDNAVASPLNPSFLEESGLQHLFT